MLHDNTFCYFLVLLSTPLIAGQCNLSPGQDCRGGDISSVTNRQDSSVTHANACCALCQATPGCAAFTFAPWDGQGSKNPTCYLKSRCLDKAQNSAATAGEIANEACNRALGSSGHDGHRGCMANWEGGGRIAPEGGGWTAPPDGPGQVAVRHGRIDLDMCVSVC